MDEVGEVFEAGGLSHAELTTQIVVAYVSNNRVPATELSVLIASVHAAVTDLGGSDRPEIAPQVVKPTPAQIKRSVTPDGLVSFIDGKTYQTLRRHLSRHGLEPQGYRARYGLPADYPMTAANYSARRSELARTIGLGQIRRKGLAAPEPEPAAATPGKRGRGKAQAAK